MEPKVVVNGVEYPIATLDTLTLGELAEAEQITGQGYDLEKDGWLGSLAIRYISVKRVDPRVTLDDLKHLSQSDVEMIGEADAGPPADGASNENALSSPTTSDVASE